MPSSAPRFLLLLVSLAFARAVGACATDDDCEMLGVCNVTTATCACARGFTGPSCGALDFLPAPPLYEGGMVWPLPVANAAKAASSWGYSSFVDPVDNATHAYVTVACNGSGVIGSGGGDSWIAHIVYAESGAPNGTLLGMFTPQTTFGPHARYYAAASDGSAGPVLAVVFRVNVLVNTTLCGGNSTAALPASLVDASEVPPSDLTSGNPEVGTSIYIGSAASARGPFSVHAVNVTGAGPSHKSNPSIARLPDGRWLMAYRFNPRGGGEQNAIAVADTLAGPFLCIANISVGVPAGDNEDPFVWQQPGQEGFAHILYHNAGFGYHAWGPIEGDIKPTSWQSSTKAHAFTLVANLTDGSTVAFSRRERPFLRFRDDGTPDMLYNGVVGPDGTAFSFAQPIA